MKTKTLRQSALFDATPLELYEILSDSTKHSQMIEADAFISPDEGGDFSLWGGSIRGKNLELVPGKRIVQTWHCDTEGWPRDHFSKVTFSFLKRGTSACIELVQSDVPEVAFGDIEKGWEEYYWLPLREYLAKEK